LAVILTAEETGVSAYLGAAGFLDSPALIEAASSIYSTESRHSAVINLTLGKITGTPPATAAPGPYNFTGGAQPLTNAAIPATFLNGSTAVYPGTAEFALAPTQILNAIKPFFVM